MELKQLRRITNVYRLGYSEEVSEDRCRCLRKLSDSSPEVEVSRTYVGPVLLVPVKQLAGLPALFRCVPLCMSNKCSGWFAASAIVSNI
jgi:hypothetical protein